MPSSTDATSRRQTLVLVIEADLAARSRHEETLRSAGYSVVAFTSCPDVSELRLATVVLSDVASFHWQREWPSRPLPPTVVVTDDERAGIIACLCGAAGWVPVAGGDARLLNTLEALLYSRDGAAADE